MKYKILPFKPVITIASATLVTAAAIFTGGTLSGFEASLDDCGGLLDSIRIEGEFYSHVDDFGGNFTLSGGETCMIRPEISPETLLTSYHLGVRTAVRGGELIAGGSELLLSDMRLVTYATLPEGESLDDAGLEYDENGRAICNYSLNGSKFLKIEPKRVKVQYAIADGKHFVPLGEAHVMENSGIMLYLKPKMSYGNEKNDDVSFDFSPDISDYYYLDFDFFGLANKVEEYDNTELIITEKGEKLYAYHVDRIANSIVESEISDENTVATRELMKLNLDDGRVLYLDSDSENMLIVSRKNGRLIIDFSDGKSSIRREIELDSESIPDVDGAISNGVAVVRWSIRNDSGEYVTRRLALKANGELLDDSPCESSLPDLPYTGLNLRNLSGNFDAYYDGERLYLLENAYYSLSRVHGTSREWLNRAGRLLAKDGAALTRKIVRVTVIDDGVTREFYPLSTELAGYGAITLKLKFANN